VLCKLGGESFVGQFCPGVESRSPVEKPRYPRSVLGVHLFEFCVCVS